MRVGFPNPGEIILDLDDSNERVGSWIYGFEGLHDGCEIGKRNVNGRRLLIFCDANELCVANTQFEKEDRRKITCSRPMGKNKPKLILCWLVKATESIKKT